MFEVIIATDHDFDLHLYWGPEDEVPRLPFHIHESQFKKLIEQTRDPLRLKAILGQEVEDVFF